VGAVKKTGLARSIRNLGGAMLALVLAMVTPMTNAHAATKGKVLVFMSSAHMLDLKGGKKYTTATI
jgi:hypothetical protein